MGGALVMSGWATLLRTRACPADQGRGRWTVIRKTPASTATVFVLMGGQFYGLWPRRV